MSTVNPLCGQVSEGCICTLTPDHTEPHVCDCGGSWSGTIDGDDFAVVSFPGLFGPLFGGRL